MSHLIRELKKDSAPSPYRLWYNDWVERNVKGKVLDVGKSAYWDYGFPTLDINPELKPTYIGDIQKTAFPDQVFDVVLCNGMYEFVSDPQKMIDEVLRITRKTAIFGFVGKDYQPYRKQWKYYENKETIPAGYRKDFGNEYHFIICQKVKETPLCELAYKYGTDKCPKLGHSYTPVYYELLKDKREKFRKVLEIGIGSKETLNFFPDHYQLGASLKMWRDFFPHAWIYGMDYSHSAVFQGERITTFILNSMKANHMKTLLEKTGLDLDLVIDDGDHRTYAQLRTFKLLMPKLKKDVIYVIEDSKNPYALKHLFEQNGYYCQVFQFPDYKQDNLVVVQNRDG